MNLFDLPRFPLTEEFVEILSTGENFRVEKIVSSGQTTDWLEQNETEFVALLQGEAALEFADGKIVEMSRGATVLINPGERHRVTFTSVEPPCVWLCFFIN